MNVESVSEDGGLGVLSGAIEQAGVDAFVDSGVLLGLRRGGALNPWEKDIDLGVLAGQVPALLRAVSPLQDAGFRVDVQRYRGTVFSVGIRPAASVGPNVLRASVHVYYAIGDWLWSPQTQIYVPPPAPDVLLGPRGVAGELLRRIAERRFYRPETADGRASRPPDTQSAAHRAAAWAYRRVDRGRLAGLWAVGEIYVPMTWVVPRDLVEPLGDLEVGTVSYRVPAKVEQYLAYRYGDWSTPVQDWCYWEDDGAIRRDPPEQVARELVRVAAGRP